MESTIIKISKPGKDPTNPSNYREIALTSALCKVRERMVYKTFGLFEQKGTLSALQCGGRDERTTIDRVLFLEATVRKAQGNREQVVSILFDMEQHMI